MTASASEILGIEGFKAELRGLVLVEIKLASILDVDELALVGSVFKDNETTQSQPMFFPSKFLDVGEPGTELSYPILSFGSSQKDQRVAPLRPDMV